VSQLYKMASQTTDPAVDAQTKVPEIIAVLTVCCVLTTSVVLLRVMTRCSIVRIFGPDDWTMVMAQVRY
jgi:hypothetical protein